MTDTLAVGSITQLTETGSLTRFAPLTRIEVDCAQFARPDPRDARIAAQAQAYETLAQECVWTHQRIAELEAQVAKLGLFPQQVMDAIEQFDWDGEPWFIDDIRAIIEGKAGYPADDDSLWFTGAEWQSLLDRAIAGECAVRDARIAELEAALRDVYRQVAKHRPLAFQDAALMPGPERDMAITTEEMDA